MRIARLIPLLLACSPAMADMAEAEQLLRDGRAAESVAALQGEESAEACYWRGRALISLGRLAEAAEQLKQVPDGCPLYPYAAKALLYCAWQSPEVDFPSTVTPLTISRRAEIAHLATAALAEYRLMHGVAEGNAAMDLLRSQAGTQAELNAVLHLLEVRELRLQGQLQEAEQRCRKLEQERDLPTAMRHRARLELAEIYYEREQHAETAPDGKEEDAEETALRVTNAHGTGEETLLHFISAYAESPLLHEAFRRLANHRAFEDSEYARAQLKEWGADTRYPHRAAIALYISQHLQNNNAGLTKPLDSTCVNTAIAACPQDPVTEAMILEQARWLIERGEQKEAKLYLQMVQKDSPLRAFLCARLLPQDTDETAEAYLNCAAKANPALRRAALSNALLCALRAGNDEQAGRVMEDSPDDTAALTEVIIGFYLERGEYEPAELWLQNLDAQQEPESADMALDRVLLALGKGDTQAAAQALEALPQEALNNKRRLFALQDAYCLHSGAAPEETLKTLQETAKGDDTLLPVLADRYLEANHPKEALELLQPLLANKELNSELLPAALYMAARASERLNTLPALRRAAELYEHCAATDPAYAVRANMRLAAVLSRIGCTQEALALLPDAEAAADYNAEDKVLLALIRSTALMLAGTPESRAAAAATTQELVEHRKKLPTMQQYRLLLHHGAICSRLGQTEEALQSYTEALALKSPTPGAAEWDALFFAAAGAVTKYEQLERFEEAADLADTAAQWNSGDPKQRAAKFRAWADHLRQTHFLKARQP